jgi:tripartite-type tricarboxylate transporter receptor subunit TctC
MSPAEFAAYIRADLAKWKKVIADAKIPLIGG